MPERCIVTTALQWISGLPWQHIRVHLYRFQKGCGTPGGEKLILFSTRAVAVGETNRLGERVRGCADRCSSFTSSRVNSEPPLRTRTHALPSQHVGHNNSGFFLFPRGGGLLLQMPTYQHHTLPAGKHQLSKDKLLLTLHCITAPMKCYLLSVLSLCEMSEILAKWHLYISRVQTPLLPDEGHLCRGDCNQINMMRFVAASACFPKGGCFTFLQSPLKHDTLRSSVDIIQGPNRVILLHI